MTAILTLPRMLQRSAWMRVLPLLTVHPRAFMRITRIHAEKHAPPREGAGRDARYGTPNSAVPRYCRTNANRARAAVRESTKRNYARECAKNPHDDADLHTRRNARRNGPQVGYRRFRSLDRSPMMSGRNKFNTPERDPNNPSSIQNNLPDTQIEM
ncbi:hypothetical protein HW555_002949 [Spodoptera exigua]|uniref:Uncharacterized protein n=1 Tax=Spodoptera exigua TaxID=7107 RepID=A0A835GQ98_SPOEX|nr:hypothetical protein HW555_002949 [Spodoptera exigua]